jgi:DMSO/TMAO reductase YedYZ molybdopterin-dependent catalytic subunit
MQENTMPKTISYIVLMGSLLLLVACGQRGPDVDWELTIDGDVNQPVTYTYQDLIGMRHTKLTGILTQNPDDPDEKASWEGVTLFLLFQKPGGVEYDIEWSVLVTLDEGTRERYGILELRGAIIALKDGQGNWLANGGPAPIKLVPPNLPSSKWVDGPVRITVLAP